MRVCLSIVILLGLSGSWLQSPAQTTCSGTVTGPAGRLPAAHATLMTADRTIVLQTAEASGDGEYSLTVPRPGLWVVKFTGVGYADQSVGLYVPDAAPIRLSVVLGGYRYVKGPLNLTVVGDFNLWNVLRAVPLKKQKDGTYSAVIPVPKDSLRYRIAGYRDQQGVEGIQGATYVLNREGSYDARMHVVGGKAVVKVDPRRLDRSGAKATITFASASDRTRKIAEAIQTWWDGEQAYSAGQLDALYKRKSSGTSIPTWLELNARLQERKAAEKDTLVRSVWNLAWISTGVRLKQKETESMTRAMEEIAPTSPVWAFHPNVMSYAVRNTSWPRERQRAYVESAIQDHPDRGVRVAVTYNEFMLLYQADENSAATPYFDLLTGEYADTPEGKTVIKGYPRPDRTPLRK